MVNILTHIEVNLFIYNYYLLVFITYHSKNTTIVRIDVSENNMLKLNSAISLTKI
ncbi:hypothetical protein VagYM19_08910 [Vibrio alginolyticus]|nr:hypothetical protein Vag1382_08900 [Vibrio alginolyticus]BCB46364.1 hypothetical protein VagVIO5_08900 [Vibrio alginolyticus]BCB50965.1 hypothetical protein VagYM19_08910 [Vibrio alginolyticus]BCB55568.1 hypothetical protein VagYM4_08910 [Vibrio alginolyticus]